MFPASSYLVYQCYGNESIFHECAYSLLSLCRHHSVDELKELDVWIYTDKPAWFARLNNCPIRLNFREIDKETIILWRGAIDFVHRVKIELLKDVLKDKNGNMLYVDTDTVFINRIDTIFQNIELGNLYMHVMEGNMNEKGNPVIAKLYDFLIKDPDPKYAHLQLTHTAMWNAGVLGFNSSYKQILNDVLSFTDIQYPHYTKHIIEQFAFSAYFQQAGNVKTAAPSILHYWNLKEVRDTLLSFFEHFKDANWNNLIGYSQLIQMPVLMQDKANFYSNRSIHDKILKKKWTPPIPNWEILLKQL